MKLKSTINYWLVNNGEQCTIEEFIDLEKNENKWINNNIVGGIIIYLLENPRKIQNFIIDIEPTTIFTFTSGKPKDNYALDDILDIRIKKEEYQKVDIEVEVSLYESGQKI